MDNSTSTGQGEQRTSRSWINPPSLGALRNEVTGLVESILGESVPQFRADTIPRVDVVEKNSHLEIIVDLPGYRSSDVSIDLTANNLVISGERNSEVPAPEESCRYYRQERRLGGFTRSISLPCPVSDALVDAFLQDGVLRVRLPKHEDGRKRHVPIRDVESPST
ncbi:Hsp20/alpha crystallin family protein [Planctomicrobium sp. SH527]|uniref:Hsp20/alpha crystallin family protein n=1 Tax=Planctomicrobium sp. SH527 TaxID=3448123 RepID=UPI003F5BD67E